MNGHQRIWRIHLSTAVLLAIVSGLLLLGNVRLAEFVPEARDESRFMHNYLRFIAVPVSLGMLVITAIIAEHIIDRRNRRHTNENQAE